MMLNRNDVNKHLDKVSDIEILFVKIKLSLSALKWTNTVRKTTNIFSTNKYQY